MRGRKRKYPWGDEFDENKCNTRESGISSTTPVGKYSPDGDSPYGCADMAGNVREWTSRRVVRGGSFYYGQDYARSAYRYDDYPDYRYDDYPDFGGFDGFRVGVAAAPFSPDSAL